MSSTPFISVLINNYNYARFTAQCIESVLAQTYTNFELIIVDDGSSDNSYEIISSFKDDRIKTIFKENGGQASAFNAGYTASSGEIICFLDSDDWWMPNKLETIVKWHSFTKGEYGLMQHNVDVWDNGSTYPYFSAMYSGNCFQHTINTGQLGIFVGTSGLSFKREILEKVMPVPNEFRISADAYLTRTTFTFNKVISIPESLAYYRKHNNAVLGNNSYSHSSFNNNILFPALNKFYEKNNIIFRFDGNQVSKRSEFSEITIRQYLNHKFNKITNKYHRVALFGAGLHTVWLQEFLSSNTNAIVAVLDDNPDNKSKFWELSTQKASEWNIDDADAIILSSDRKQEKMRKRCIELFGNSIPLIDLYDEIPEDPYKKS
jgi:glycosyltransferase involved in cell wall biosynthesis